MKKIGIVTLYGNHNMGNKLQTYAVMQLYRSLGYDVALVNHCEQEIIPPPTLTGRIQPIVREMLLRINPNIHPKLKRRRLFLDFSERYLIPSESVSMKRIPPDLKERYDFFSVGSDQVWHNWSGVAEEELHFFFLRFAERKQRLCLSPSFGLERVPESEAGLYREGLNGFPCLSCREMSGVKLIRDLTGRDAALLPDPTMGLSAGDWTRLERKPAYSLPERYVLSYMLGPLQPEMTDAVSRYVRLLRMDVVNINEESNLTEAYAATGPQEFLYLIRHASLVCTNSFHGTVFSILFRKNFVCFERDDFAVAGDMSNRIVTLLNEFRLSSRRYGVLSNDDLLSAPYGDAEETLTLERERILNYLREAIEETQTTGTRG